MLIQYIGYFPKNALMESKDILVNSISTPHSLDEFNINVIDLSDEYFWKYTGSEITSMNNMADIIHLNKMISNSKASRIIIIYPQNCNFKYSYSSQTGNYRLICEMKNILEIFRKTFANALINHITCELIYENTKTYINEKQYEAAFYFDSRDAITTSLKSNKATTIEIGEMILTTLKIKTSSEMIDFLEYLKLINNKVKIPEWVQNIDWLDDVEKKQIIETKLEEIKSADLLINEAQRKLDDNNRYKSILHSNGDELVEVVFEILEQLLDCDLSKFEDEKNEDFIIKLENITFIGEIKGVTTNAKSEYVSQLDVHLQSYLENPDKAKEEKVKSLLIINHQRNKPLMEREPINETQIKLAERNRSLIIETSTLLHIFEEFKIGEITTEEISEIFTNNIGIYSL